ncbi:hypothetical protein CABS01_03164 [Colletotrichum abscissum]|uniref:uncharacterized protein n=1 Tax=Colletotrichum abscissum TaxID=1671311 RepID=UPI0027D5AFEA|nr:uncharacterized protein CABS01_03164 [Colletotrichum abscissum]KAK1477862.1 hypothetical protein CABS01_03164 [Colletotrichum abscissum]
METTMPRRPHLELFNPDSAITKGASFVVFQQFPIEIRLLIWKHALQRHRMIHIILEKGTEQRQEDERIVDETDTLINSLGRRISGYHYKAIIETQRSLLPDLTRVNREARDAVSSFYSTQLPCRFRRDKHSETISIIRLNLDWDYLRVSHGKAHTIFFDFIHDLRAYDPKGRGLQHLVVEGSDYRTSTHNPSPLKHTFAEGPSLDAFRATAAKNLKSLWFKCTPRGARALNVLDWRRVHVFNYGVPVFPNFTFFDAPLPDPRVGIVRDLEKIGGTVYDPREGPLGWRKLLRDAGVRPEDVANRGQSRDLDVRIMYASSEEGSIRTREDAARVLHEEDFRWLGLQWWFHGWDTPAAGGRAGGERPAGCFSTASGLQAKRPEFDGPEVLAAAPRPALGFWLFPVEAFGGIPGVEEETSSWLKVKWIWDLSPHRPELALVDSLIACGFQLNHTLLAKQGVDEDVSEVADNGIDECIDEDIEEIINVRHGVKTYSHSL